MKQYNRWFLVQTVRTVNICIHKGDMCGCKRMSVQDDVSFRFGSYDICDLIQSKCSERMYGNPGVLRLAVYSWVNCGWNDPVASYYSLTCSIKLRKYCTASSIFGPYHNISPSILMGGTSGRKDLNSV